MSDTDSDEPQIPPPKRRKLWLTTGAVPRTTLQRWQQQELGPGPNHEYLESNTTGESTSSSSSSGEEEEGEIIYYEEINPNAGEGDGNGEAEEVVGENAEEFQEEIGQEVHEEMEEDIWEDAVQDELVQFHPEELYNRSPVTCGQAILQLMEIYSVHAMTKSCLADVVKFVHGLLPRDNSFPSTFYYLEQTLHPFMPPEFSSEHVCCKKCDTYIGIFTKPAVPCPVCSSTEVNRFHVFDLPTLIKYLFENRNLADALDSYGAGKGADITRSEEYLRVKEKLQGIYDLVLHWNFDGVKAHNNSQSSMWPVMFDVCGVAPQLRGKYSMIAGLWHAPNKPKVNSYLVPFTESLIRLSVEGVSWVHPRTKETHVSRVLAPVLSVDAPARAMAQNLLQYNGEFSCNICEVEGMPLRRGPRSRKRVVPVEDDPAPLRTKESMKEAATRAERENVIVKGVKGSTLLEAIPEFDASKSITLDYMHLVLLGIVRMFFKLWFNSSESNDWYVRNGRRRLTTFLKSIRPTYETTRCPKDAENWKNFKASTWRTWLLFVSLPALKGLLKEKYFQHWTLLVMGIALLLQEEISENERLFSEQLLALFVRDTQALYGYSAMTYNLHGLLHLPLVTRRWGALWAVSLFKFEGFNGLLTRLLHGTFRITAELSNTLRLILATKTVKILMHGIGLEDHRHNQFHLLSGKNCIDDCIPAAGRNAIAAHFPGRPLLTFYGRAERHNTTFTSEMYNREKATDNKHVCFKSGNIETYGAVQCYILHGEDKYALIRQLEVEVEKFFKTSEIDSIIKHIIPVKESDVFKIMPLSQLACKLFKVNDVLCKELNHYEQKL